WHISIRPVLGPAHITEIKERFVTEVEIVDVQAAGGRDRVVAQHIDLLRCGGGYRGDELGQWRAFQNAATGIERVPAILMRRAIQKKEVDQSAVDGAALAAPEIGQRTPLCQ